MRHGLAYHLGPLGGEQRLVDLRFVRCRPVERVVFVSQHHPFVCGQGPQALIPCGGREPGSDAVRMLDPVYVLDEPHPGRLKHVRRVAFQELEVPGNRPDKAAVAVNEPLPGLWIAVDGPAHQPGHVEIRVVWAGFREAARGGPFNVLLRYYRASRHRPP